MKIVGVREFGGPETLAVHEAAEPHAGPGQVRIRVHAAAVNPTDAVLRAGYNPAVAARHDPPYVPGMDAAGVIDEVGDGSGFTVGDKVMTMAQPSDEHGGAYVQFLIADADAVSLIPVGTSYAQASTLPMNGLTALRALDELELKPGEVLAVTGAAGILGRYTIALAKYAGLTVVADYADKDLSLVSATGADHLVKRGDNIATNIRELYPEGVDGLLDASVQNKQAAGALRDGGGFVTVRGWQGPAERGITIHPVLIYNEENPGGRLNMLRTLVEAGILELPTVDLLPAVQAPASHARLEAGGVRYRLVLTFDELCEPPRNSFDVKPSVM